MMDARDFYDSLGEDYDRMVSWEVRLEREHAFFKRLFDEHGVRSVLDAGCGTGMHAVAFARLGLRSAGADLSPAMIEQAREHAKEAGVAMELAVASFGGLAGCFRAPFDAVTCLGNSLPHMIDDAALAAALADFAAALRPGGLLVIQDRNYDRVLRERQRFMPLTAREGAEGETLFLRLTEFGGGPRAREEDIEFTIVTLRKRGGQWSQAVQTTALRALRRTTLERALVAAGFASIEVYGNYALAPYDSPNTGDLVAIALKGA
jgi:glycine/sarcosine N-methyltransferase